MRRYQRVCLLCHTVYSHLTAQATRAVLDLTSEMKFLLGRFCTASLFVKFTQNTRKRYCHSQKLLSRERASWHMEKRVSLAHCDRFWKPQATLRASQQSNTRSCCWVDWLNKLWLQVLGLTTSAFCNIVTSKCMIIVCSRRTASLSLR